MHVEGPASHRDVSSLLAHDNLVTVLGANFQGNVGLGFISEFYPHGNLETLLRENHDDLTIEEWISLGLDMAEGMVSCLFSC